MKKYLSILLLVLSMCMAAACKHTDEEVYPIRFGNIRQTVVLGITNRISFVDGGGEYRITVEKPDVLGIPEIDKDLSSVVITPLKLGESALTIHDVRANAYVVLHVSVEEFHLIYTILRIEGTNQNPYISLNDDVRLIRSDDGSRKVSVERNGKVLGEGLFDINTTDSKLPMMQFSLHHNESEEFELFEYQIFESGNALNILGHCFGFDWSVLSPDSARSRMSVSYSHLNLKASNGCIVTGIIHPNK